MTIRNLSVVLMVIIANMICGCSIIKISDPNTGANLANHGNLQGTYPTVSLKQWGVKDGDYYESLSNALERHGVKVIDRYSRASKRDFYLKSYYTMTLTQSLASYSWLTWDVLMGIPSIILPVPLVIRFDATIEVKLLFEDGEEFASRKIETGGWCTLFGVWSSIPGAKDLPEAFANAAANIAIEMLPEPKDIAKIQ
jgi:hypothetical protein